MTLREIYEKFVNLSRSERADWAKGGAGTVLEYLEKQGVNDEDSFKYFLCLTALFVGADGVVDADEHRLFSEITGYTGTREDLQEVLKAGFSAEFVANMDRIIDAWPEDVKAGACFYGLALISADGTISAREQQVFERILA